MHIITAHYRDRIIEHRELFTNAARRSGDDDASAPAARRSRRSMHATPAEAKNRQEDNSFGERVSMTSEMFGSRCGCRRADGLKM